jgi:hypothetical protein
VLEPALPVSVEASFVLRHIYIAASTKCSSTLDYLTSTVMDEAILLQNYHRTVRSDNYFRCLIFREKLYDLKLKLYQAVARTFNSWEEASEEARNIQYTCYIPRDGDFDSVDPSNLLILISASASFVGGISRAARLVKELRNCLYGHVPELEITDILIRNKLGQRRIFRGLNLRDDPQAFQTIVSQLDQLAVLL